MTVHSAEALEVRVNDLHKQYRSFHALRGVSFQFGPGVTCLLGKNGAGKSTLVRQVVGVESPTTGSVEFRQDEGSGSVHGVPQRQVGWLPQIFGFPSGMRVNDFVSYAAWLKGVGRDQRPSLTEEAVLFAGLEKDSRKKLGELSGGTLRRAGLAAAVVHRPSVLILDEPTAGLDPVQRDDFHRRIGDLGAHSSILVATHLLEDVQALAERICVVDDGRIIWQGTSDELARVGGGSSAEVDALRAGLIELVGGGAS